MKKLNLILMVLLFPLGVFAQELQCGVSYDVNSARQYLQAGQIDYISPASNLYFDGTNAKNCDTFRILTSAPLDLTNPQAEFVFLINGQEEKIRF